MPKLNNSISARAGERDLTTGPAMRITLLSLFLLVAATSVRGAAVARQSNPAAELQSAQHGVDLLMNGKLEDAIQVFRQIQARNPSSPLGYLLEADAIWWKIYLTSGNLIDPDVFDVVSSDTTPFDGRFERMVRIAIAKSQANIRADRDVPRNELYEGLAYALRARLLGLRGKDLPTARAGKKMRSLLMDAIAQDPSLMDADLGIGIYNYFVDTLPGIVRLLRWLIGLPGGNRELGLEQLRAAAEHAQLTSGEALFYLAKDYSRPSEGKYQRSLQYFQELAHRYPDNGLWKILSGSIAIRLGNRKEGEQIYKEVYDATRGQDSIESKALHRASHLAIERIDPDTKLSQ